MPESNARTFEWLILLSVIGGIVLVAVGFYTRMIGDVQRLSFELAAQHFETAVSGARAQWYIARSRGETNPEVVLYGDLTAKAQGEAETGQDSVRVYLNTQGWPANTQDQAGARDGQQTPEECLQLWQGLLREPPAASFDESGPSEAAFQIEVTGEGVCRYRHLIGDGKSQYFDYDSRSGQIIVHSSQK